MRTRQEFLAEPHVAALAVAAGPGRDPLTDGRASPAAPARGAPYPAITGADHGPGRRVHLRPERRLSADLGPS